MRTSRHPVVAAVMLALLAAAPAWAQSGLVVQQHTSFEIARVSSGDLTQTVHLSGTQQLKTVTQGRAKMLLFSQDASGTEIVRLDQDKFYSLDDKKRSYKVQSMAEVRARLEKSQHDMEQAAAAMTTAADTSQVRLYVINNGVQRTGERKTINGFQTEQSVLRMTVMGEDKKTGEKAPLFVLTADLWLDASQHQAVRANEAFYQAYIQHLGIDPRTVLNPYGRWVSDLQAESAKLQGYPILSTYTLEAAEDPKSAGAQGQSAPSASGAPASAGDAVGKALGGLMRRAQNKKDDAPTSARPVLFRTTTEVKSISTTAPAAAEFEVPAGYRQG